ncbi:hypothetical protein LZ198_25790 [Myxococcus sp. K15C18031901]|uniref:hypothetical protein n=1 Tax=Myxococcus dinghuensis TaxID=2906761 RepID=UPI0020A7F51A|nr:hypothetical protein [Myxococcus dinghuensis]MCP3102287.1 hypothetical protein [Myxococcus dinghuensis]
MKLGMLVGGVLCAVSGLALGCGGADAVQEVAPEMTMEAEQSLVSCPAGYTPFIIWECEQGCTWTVNVAYLWCTSTTNPSDSYNAGATGQRSCGACF